MGRMTGPLDGVRIVDFTVNISGPIATMVLGDQGADVVKVEPLGGDPLRVVGTSRAGMSAFFANANRNKRSVAIDLTVPAGRALAERLIQTADVVVQNFRPAAAERLGLTGPGLRKLRPELVYASITGFGTEGPYAGRPVYDHVIQAASGIAANQADRHTGQPSLVRQALVDKVAGLHLAQGVTAALLRRYRTGVGCELEVCMLDSAIAFLWPDGMMNHTILDPDTVRPSIANTFRLTPTRDGHVALNFMTDAQWVGALKAVDYDPPAPSDGNGTTPVQLRSGAVMKEVARRLSARTTEAVVETLGAHDVPCAPVVSLDDLPTHPQVVANASIHEVDHPLLGRIREARAVVDFQGSSPGESRPAPALGQHTEEILEEIGIAPGELDRLYQEGVVKTQETVP